MFHVILVKLTRDYIYIIKLILVLVVLISHSNGIKCYASYSFQIHANDDLFEYMYLCNPLS